MSLGGGKTYEYSGETTEWEDILIKKGIATREGALLSRGLNPADFIKPEVEEEPTAMTRAEELEGASLQQLDDMEEDDEFDDSRMIDEYRERRLRELQEQAVRNKYGDVVEISKDEWLREVTEGSASTWVLVHLYQDSVVDCQLLDETLRVIAPKFRYVKIVRIRSTQAVENWPDRNLPTLFAYHENKLQHQIMTLKELGGRSMSADDLEWWLAQHGIVSSELEEDPRAQGAKKSVSTIRSPIRRGGVADSDQSDED